MDTSRINEARAPERRGTTRNRRHAQVYFETFFMAGVLSSQSYLQMKTLSAALEQSEEIMQWITSSARGPGPRLTFRPSRHRRDSLHRRGRGWSKFRI